MKSTRNLNSVFTAEQKQIDQIDIKDKKEILQSIKNTEQKITVKYINNSVLITNNNSKSKLKILHELYFFIVNNY